MLILKAVKFARKAHKGQKRKYTFEPYIFHPINVGFILSYITQDENIIAAGILHDTIEDTWATEDIILNKFGDPVRIYVTDVTDTSQPSDGNRKVRKRIDLEHLAKGQPESKTVKLADILDNAHDIKKNDPEFAQRWMGEKRELLPYLIEGDPMLFKLVTEILG